MDRQEILNKCVINEKRTLCIPDIHQNVEWATTILDNERGNYEQVVQMGDIFDSHFEPPEVASVKETAEFALALTNNAWGPTTILWGNHDIPIAESFRHTSRHRTPDFLFTECSGYTNNKAKTVNKVLKWADWTKREWFMMVNGRLISHAGFAEPYWNQDITVDANLVELYKQGKEAISRIGFDNHPFFAVGVTRGGLCEFGGPAWLDWNNEFIDRLPVPQLVGHTKAEFNWYSKKGNSLCIDACQTTYAIIEPNGDISLYSFEKKHGQWIKSHVASECA